MQNQQVRQLENMPVINQLATNLRIDGQDVCTVLANTIFSAKKGGQQVTEQEIVAFAVIANEYGLNPFTKEIYAFNNRGAIQPIVSVDGWIKIINSHPQLDGIKFLNHFTDNGELFAITCQIYRKDRSHPTEAIELLSECRMDTDPWHKYPHRMLRHKALIQAARIAFGFSGIVDPDEAERYEATDLGGEPKDVTPDKAASWLEEALAITDLKELKKYAESNRINYSRFKAEIDSHAAELKAKQNEENNDVLEADYSEVEL